MKPSGKAYVYVKQTDIQDVVDGRAYLDGLKKELKAAEIEVAKREETVLAKLRLGLPIEVGGLEAEIVTTQQVRPAWKDVCLQKNGEAFVEAVIAATPPSVTEKLAVRPTANRT